MSGMFKIAAAAAVATLVASGAFAGGPTAPIVESEPFVETRPAGSLGGALPIILAAVLIGAIATSSSNGTN